eukprot:scaffold37756_cov20-Tisochrysis_lutea.AAC.5
MEYGMEALGFTVKNRINMYMYRQSMGCFPPEENANAVHSSSVGFSRDASPIVDAKAAWWPTGPARAPPCRPCAT